jgi:hypothetical protein
MLSKAFVQDTQPYIPARNRQSALRGGAGTLLRNLAKSLIPFDQKWVEQPLLIIPI